MAGDDKEGTKVFSQLESHYVHVRDKEDKTKVDWYFLEVYEGRIETELLKEALADKECRPDDVLHILFDYTFFERVTDGEYDWRIGNDRELKEKCRGYVAQAKEAEKEIEAFAGPGGIARKVGQKGAGGGVNVYRQLLADASDKNKTQKLLRNMMKTDLKRAFEAAQKTMSLYSALAEVRHRIEGELLSRLISPKVKSRTAPIDDDFELPAAAEEKEAGTERKSPWRKSADEAKPDEAGVINLDDVKLEDV